MAYGDIQKRAPNPRSVWRCPCGYENSYWKVMGHRGALKHHPECEGTIVMLWDGVDSPVPLTLPEVLADTRSAQSLAEPVSAVVSEELDVSENEPKPEPATSQQLPELDLDELPIVELDGEMDPEEIARRYNQMKELGGTVIAPPRNGDGAYGDLGEGWQPVTPSGEPQVSETKLMVKVPNRVYDYYDWARSVGWHVGSGSLDDFVADWLDDHFQHCLGRQLVVIRRGDLNGG